MPHLVFGLDITSKDMTDATLDWLIDYLWTGCTSNDISLVLGSPGPETDRRLSQTWAHLSTSSPMNRLCITLSNFFKKNLFDAGINTFISIFFLQVFTFSIHYLTIKCWTYFLLNAIVDLKSYTTLCLGKYCAPKAPHWPVEGASAQDGCLVLRTIDGEDVEESGKNMFWSWSVFVTRV